MTIERKVGVAYSIRFGIGAVLYSVGVLVGLRWARSMGDDPWRFVVVMRSHDRSVYLRLGPHEVVPGGR